MACKPIINRKKFAKLITYAHVYQLDTEWEEDISKYSREYAETQVRKMGIPDGWQSCGNYDSLKDWFLKNGNY